jgi:hypothetical protein
VEAGVGGRKQRLVWEGGAKLRTEVGVESSGAEVTRFFASPEALTWWFAGWSKKTEGRRGGACGKAVDVWQELKLIYLKSVDVWQRVEFDLLSYVD